MVTEAERIRQTLDLMEGLLTQTNVLNIPILPYDLSTLMKEYRAETPTYNQFFDKVFQNTAVILDNNDLKIKTVIAKGQIMLEDNKLKQKGTFE